MARYLTPVQVCFLVLIDLYATGQVTSTTGSSFLSFLAHNIILYTSNEPSPAAGRNSLRSLENAQGLQRALSNIQSPLPGRTIYDVLLQRIWELDTPHNLQNFIGDTLRLLAGTTPKATTLCFSPWSPLGQYIRRCYVEMTRLHFTGILDLWKAFFTFRAPTFRTWAHRNPDAARQVHENEADEAFPPPSSAREGNGPLSSSSANEIDHLVNLEVQRLQQVGGRTSTELREHLQKCLSNATGDPALRYFIEYLDRCRAGQYTVALESLHRYFDYTLNASQGSAGPGSAKSYYQYALLHLSVLHAEFGNTEESRETLEECIAIARENQDTACLNFALSWLFHLRRIHPDDVYREKRSVLRSRDVAGGFAKMQDEIKHLKIRSRDAKLWNLSSSTFLEEASQDLAKCRAPPNRAIHHILQSAHLNLDHSLRMVMPAQMLMQGVVFARLGQADLALCCNEIVTHTFHSHSPHQDLVRARCRTASDFALGGRYDEACATLQAITQLVKGDLILRQRVLACMSLVELRREIHRDNVDAAEHHLTAMAAMSTSTDPDLACETQLQRVELMVRKGDFPEAFDQVSTLLQRHKADQMADNAQRLRLLTLKSRMFAFAGKPLKAFSSALRSAMVAERCLLLPVLHEAIDALGGIFVDLGAFQVARALLEAMIPSALEGGNSWLVGSMYSMLADSLVGVAGQRMANERWSLLRTAQSYLEHSITAYEAVEDSSGVLTCLVKQARLLRWGGDDVAAAQVDSMYEQRVGQKRMRIAR